ncbi:xylose isomerase-like protein [Xylariales sp. PMI_506]|nr:xylose isomerase-like protein [Xylariales sp. PMI_506]
MPCRLAITSMSLGRCYAGHSFAHKLDMAQKYGYKGVELFFEDLADVASKLDGTSSVERELRAAEIIRTMCRDRDIAILCLQPFSGYDGLRDRAEHRRRLDQLRYWFQLARALGTDMIQVPSSFLPEDQVSDDMELIAADLREVADMGLAENPPVRFVYEALCFGTRVNRWDQSWDLCKAVDRPNFGLCLDTYNIAGRIYADPTSPTGKIENAEQTVRDSIALMLSTVDVSKIFYVQVVDAERLAQPLVEGHPFHHPDQTPRMSWSRNCRLFYGEQDRGAYLPVQDIARAIFQGLGFEGWVSLELFHRRMADTDPDVPRELASRGAISWAKLVRDMKLSVDTPPVLVATDRVTPSL